MVSIKQIQQANRARRSEAKTAVFVGATSGIGLGAIEALLRSVKGCKIFIVGRSAIKFARTLSKLNQIKDDAATITFIEGQVSLLREIQRICRTIAQRTDSLDLLWLSQGGLGLRENDGFTGECLPSDFAVAYYGRILFMRELSPLLSTSADGRVVSVLFAGGEGTVNAADPDLRAEGSYIFWQAQKQGVTMQSLAMRHLSIEYPSVTYVHTNPGAVSTDVHAKWADSFTGLWMPVAWLIRFALMPLFSLLAYTPQQAGEMGLYIALEERYGRLGGSTFRRVDDHAEDIPRDGVEVLEGYRKDGTDIKLWEHTTSVLERVLSSG